MFTYPGEASLAAALRVLGERPEPSEAEEEQVQELLARAVGDGLSLDGVRRATSTFCDLSGRPGYPSARRGTHWRAPIGRAPMGRRARADGSIDSLRVVGALQRAFAEGWVERIALLPPEEQVRRLSALDADHDTWLSGSRGDASVIERCGEFVRDHPIPAWRTARTVIRAAWERVVEQAPLVDAMLRVVESSSTDPLALWFAEHRRSQFAFSREICLRRHRETELAQGAPERAHAQGRREALERLIALDDSLEKLLGSRWALSDGPAILHTALTPVRTWSTEEWSRRMGLRGELTEEINKAYAAHTLGSHPIDPFVRWYVDYLWARVLAATGDLEGAVKGLREALDLATCPDETRGFLSAALDHLGQEGEAIEVLAEGVRCEPPEYRPDGSLMPTTLERTFREARGRQPPALPRATEPPPRFVEAAERNRVELESQYLAVLAERRDAAVTAFWKRVAEEIPRVFADVVSPEDLDAALGAGESGRSVRLSSARVAAAHLDEAPLSGDVDRHLLLRAVEEDVPGRQVAAEALKVLEPDGEDDAAFERNVARLPAYGRSLAVALRRLAAPLERGDGARVQALIALAEENGDAEVTAACFERAHPAMSSGAGALGWLALGADLSRRAPALAERLGGRVREGLLAGLEESSEPVAWLTALLDLDSERIETHEWSCAWLERRTASGQDPDSTLAAAELLAGRLTGDLGARATGVARELLLRRLQAAADPEDCRPLADRLMKLGMDEASRALARWYCERCSGEGQGSRGEAELGEWLLAHLAAGTSEPVRDKVGELLVAELGATRAASARIPLLERLSRLSPNDERWQDELLRARRSRSALGRKIAVAAVAVLAIGVAVLLVTRAKSRPVAAAGGVQTGANPASREASAVAAVPAAAQGGSPSIARGPSAPVPAGAGWSVRSDLAFHGDEPTPGFAPIVRALGAPADEEGKPVSPDELRRLLDDPRASEVYRAELLKYATPRSEETQEAERRSHLDIFMKPAKVDAGVAFLAEHSTELEAARTKYGVAPQDVVSVLMWESNLGKVTGKYRIANVYLGEILHLDDAFAEAERSNGALPPGPAREAHLRWLASAKRSAERGLVALLRFCKAKGVDPLRITGSWGGAIGFPQFEPTSFRYAVDGNGDGVVDLYAFSDAIPSVARFLDVHGYRADRAKALRAYDPEGGRARGVQMYAEAIARKSQAPSGPGAPTPAAEEAQEARGPSFDCAKAALDAERVICSDDHLGELDLEMVRLYRSQLAAMPGPDARKEQRQWLEEVRNACSTRECLEGVYAERIAELKRSLAEADVAAR